MCQLQKIIHVRKRQREFLIKDTLLNSKSGHKGGREFAPSHCCIVFLHDKEIYKEFKLVKYSAAGSIFNY